MRRNREKAHDYLMRSADTPTIRSRTERGTRSSRRSEESFPRRAGQFLLMVWLALFGLIYRLGQLGPKKLAILCGVLVLAIAIPVTVAALTGRQGDTGKWGFNAGDPNASYLAAAGAATATDISATPSPTPTASPTPSPTPEPHPSNMVLSRGLEARIVAELQARLMELNYMEADEPTEYFGNITESSVKLFQRQHNLSMDGKVGMETWTLLMSDQATKYTVMLGADGTDVKELQIRLRELGYMDDVTGHFGELTEAGVKRFQEINGLKVDGKVGAQTREALYSPDSKPNMFKYGEQSEELKGYQELLKKLGYLTTTPDGNYGSDTTAAVRRFQEINGLIADGYLGYETIRTLKSSSAAPNAVKLGMKGTDVENMQKLLKKLGYTNAVTGYFGEITEDAVKAFQKRNGLSADGTVGKATMSVLTSSKAKAAETSSSSSGSSGSGSGSSSGGSSSSSSSSSGSSTKVNKLIEIAKSKIGCSYVYATKGPNTFDCSGFVYYCLKEAGVSASYMTSAGWAKTDKYQRISSMSDIKKGDVLVFSGTGSTGHVGIYAGGGSMVDASSSRGKVRTTDVTTNYWKTHFICAYRVF